MSHAPKIVPIASMRVATFGSSATRRSNAAPGVGEVVRPAEMVEDHRQPGEVACKVRQSAVRVRRRGRRAGLECRNEPDPHAGHQHIRPQPREELLEPAVGRVAERDESDHTPGGVLGGDPFGRGHRVGRTGIGPGDAPHVEP